MYKKLMTDIWRDGNTLRVIRREPYETAAAKILGEPSDCCYPGPRPQA
jgi:hypothetical protein